MHRIISFDEQLNIVRDVVLQKDEFREIAKMSMHDYDDYIARTQPKLGGIVFICNSVVRSACQNKCTRWRHGECRISHWQYGRDFWLWTTPKLKYRIAFIADEEGILPLQPCVEISKEKSSTISACS